MKLISLIKDNWFFKSLISGVAAGIIGYVYIPTFKVAFGISVLVTVILLFYNPKRWLRRIFILLFTTWCFQWRKTFEIISDIFDIKFEITGNRWSENESLILLSLCGLVLILDFIERKGKIRGTFFKQSKKESKAVYGDDNSINVNGKDNSVTRN